MRWPDLGRVYVSTNLDTHKTQERKRQFETVGYWPRYLGNIVCSRYSVNELASQRILYETEFFKYKTESVSSKSDNIYHNFL